jgi:UDPglucose 6-dehydrogenase
VHLFLVGAGPVGLVTAVGFARLGYRVTVSDIDAARVAILTSGRAPIFEPGLEDAIRAESAAGRLEFTTDPVPPRDVPFSIVCVGTPSGPEGPLSTGQVEAAVAGLLDSAPANHVIVVRSTLPVEGPDRLAQLVDERRTAGPCATVVTNPEFMREGAGLRDFDTPSRVVTGWLRPDDREVAHAVANLYAPLHAPTLVADARSVALIKLASNVFLAARIAFANELARICDAVGADVDLVTTGMGMDDRIGRAFLNAGPGIGGSCLPEQALALPLLSARLAVPTPLIDSVSRSNRTHQQAVVARLGGLLGRPLAGARVALLGLAFKAGTDDVRESPALALARELRSAGAAVTGYDPQAMAAACRADPGLETAEDPLTAARGADAALVATEWPAFAQLDWVALRAAMAGDLVFDTRNVVDVRAARAAGLRVEVLGRRA